MNAKAGPPAHGLRRVVGVTFGIAAVVGGTIGGGILRTPGTIAGLLHDPSLILVVWLACGALVLISGAACLAAPERFAGPQFHLLTGGAMIGAFFIVTDPVSGATTPRGKLIFAAGVALITWIIRVFGAYPDGIAFATLLMNMCVPLIDMHTQPPVFGYKGDKGGTS